jgi:CheY-like chemotaxis protein
MAKIIVIDDMPGVRRAISAVLENAGHVVTEAENGEEGLKLIASTPFDLVITDIVMPGVDGTEVILALRNRPNRPPVLAVSGGGAHIGSHTALLIAKQFADAALAKPFDSTELMGVVNELLSRAA